MVALAAVVAVGLVWRKADLGLPFFWWKYGGSALWGAMVFALATVISPRSIIVRRMALACVIALAVEVSRLYQTEILDAFWQTLAGALLLGRYFSLWNLLAYGAGIILAAAAAKLLKR